MNYKNLTLITLNNTLHIKADNLDAVEVDSSCVDELSDLVFKDTKWFIKGKTNDKYYLQKGVDISELADRIEVRDNIMWENKRAFLLPSKEDECKCFRLGEGSPWQTYNCKIHNENLKECLEIVDKKSYTIEEIERAIDETMPNKYSMAWDNERFKKLFFNNLKKKNSRWFHLEILKKINT